MDRAPITITYIEATPGEHFTHTRKVAKDNNVPFYLHNSRLYSTETAEVVAIFSK